MGVRKGRPELLARISKASTAAVKYATLLFRRYRVAVGEVGIGQSYFLMHID